MATGVWLEFNSLGNFNKESSENATCHILALVPVVWDNKIYKGFTIFFFYKLFTPGVGSIRRLKCLCFVRRIFFKVSPFHCHGKQSFAWNSILWAILIKNHQTMLHTKYIGSSACFKHYAVYFYGNCWPLTAGPILTLGTWFGQSW